MAVSSLVPASAGATVAEGNAAGWGAADIKWTHISTTTPSGSTYSFSGLSGYKKYRIVCSSIKCSAGSVIGFRINNNSSSIYDRFGIGGGNGSPWYVTSQETTYHYSGYNAGTGSSGMSCEYTIDAADLTGIKTIDGYLIMFDGGQYGANMKSIVNQTSAVTSIQLISLASSFASGTISLFGGN